MQEHFLCLLPICQLTSIPDCPEIMGAEQDYFYQHVKWLANLNHFSYCYKYQPWGSCAVSLVQLSSTVESNVPGSFYILSCPLWLHAEYAHGCSVPCLSTNRLLPSRSAESCSQSASADPAPSTGCSPSSSAMLHSSAVESSVLCSVWCLQASCPRCHASPAYIIQLHVTMTVMTEAEILSTAHGYSISTLEVFLNGTCYINPCFTYLLTYWLTYLLAGIKLG